jgi:hypothetical protein
VLLRVLLLASLYWCGIASTLAQDSGLSKIVGGWANASNSLAILKTQFGWDVWLDNKGRARITQSVQYGSNIQVTTADLDCYYYASTLSGGRQMVWQLRHGEVDDCPAGQFSRTDDDSDDALLQALYSRARPAKNRWDVSTNCSHGGHFNFSNIVLKGGRYADASSSDARTQVAFNLDISLSFVNDTTVRLSGFAGSGSISNSDFFDFTGTRQTDQNTYSGGGKWGSDDTCGFTARYLGVEFPAPLIASTATQYHAVWDISVECANNSFFRYYKVNFINGRAAAGYGNATQGVFEWKLFSAGGSSIRLEGYRVTNSSVEKIDVTGAPSANDGSSGTPYSGGGTMGAQPNCRFSGRQYSD